MTLIDNDAEQNYLDADLLAHDAYNRLGEILDASQNLPILFVGSGISQRYLRTPGWHDLIQEMCELVEANAGYIISSASGNLAKAATKLAEQFHESWWHEPQFETNRSKYGHCQSNIESALKCEVVDSLPSEVAVAELGALEAEELNLLAEVKIAGAITTNYDFLLESIFKQFKVFVGQEQMLLANPIGVAEIYKIHGCCSDPNSIVLTQADYDEYEEDNPYLMAKLMSIFVEHPVIFLGYSIRDQNIRAILNRLGKIAERSDLINLTHRIIFVEWNRNVDEPTLVETPLILDQIAVPITRLVVPNFLGVFRELARANDKLPMRVVRQFQSHLYEIVRGHIPTGKITVMNLEDVNNFDEVEWAVGIGVKTALEHRGYTALSREDLIRDFLKDETELDPWQVLELVLPRLANMNNAYLPVFRYVRQAGFVSEDGISLPDSLRSKLERYLHTDVSSLRPTTSPIPHQQRWDQFGPDPHKVLASTSQSNGLMTVSHVMPENISAEQVRTFLVETQDKVLGVASGSTISNWARLVSQVDLLLYGPGVSDIEASCND